MGWRTVIVSKTAKLDYKMGYLVVRSSEEVTRIHLSEISVLVIESTAISLTAYLLVELANEKITVLYCDQKRNPHGQYLPLYGNHNTADKVRKQIQWSNESKSIIWQSVINEKIKGQAAVLNKLGFPEDANKLLGYLPQIEPGDQTNREGHAAKVYFNRLFGKGFSRSQDDNVINAELNYGYSILLSAVNREVVANGYMTLLGIHHDNMFNDFNLSCDLMEPFRPFVDLIVLEFDHKELTKESKHALVDVLNQKIVIDNREQFFTNAITIYIKSILDAIEKGDSSFIKYPDYEQSLYESAGSV